MMKLSMAVVLAAAHKHHAKHHDMHQKHKSLLDLQDDPICSSGTGCFTDHFEGESDPYKWYDVPHFGRDSDIDGTFESLEQAEKMNNHEWILSDKPKEHPTNYAVADYGIDEDVKDTFGALAASELHHNRKWVWKLQPAKKFDMGVNVPPAQKEIINATYDTESVLDGDVKTSLANTRAAEASTGYKFNYNDE